MFREAIGEAPAPEPERPKRDGDRSTIDHAETSPRFAFPRGSEIPAGYGFSVEPDAWVPNCLSGAERMDHGNSTGLAIGRLRPGAEAPAAERELSVIMRQIAREHPPYDQGFSVRVQPIAEQMSARLLACMEL